MFFSKKAKWDHAGRPLLNIIQNEIALSLEQVNGVQHDILNFVDEPEVQNAVSGTGYTLLNSLNQIFSCLVKLVNPECASL